MRKCASVSDSAKQRRSSRNPAKSVDPKLRRPNGRRFFARQNLASENSNYHQKITITTLTNYGRYAIIKLVRFMLYRNNTRKEN